MFICKYIILYSAEIAACLLLSGTGQPGSTESGTVGTKKSLKYCTIPLIMSFYLELCIIGEDKKSSCSKIIRLRCVIGIKLPSPEEGSLL
jgi:hypothetical protein